MLEEDGAKKSSVTASVPTISPLTSFGRIFFLRSSLPYFIIASVNKYTDDEKGTGARNLPSSSAITQSSKWLSPRPSNSSGILIPVQPNPTIFCHKSVSRDSDLSKTCLHLLILSSFSRNFLASF